MFGDSNSIDGGFNLAYFGHEMSHQWWGNLVGISGREGSYVFHEGLAQYGSLQVVRELAGSALAKTYRLTGYPGYSDWMCMAGALAYSVTGYDRPLSSGSEAYSELDHTFANCKGFLAWETVARTMGRQAFSSALKEIGRSHRFLDITWDDTWKTLQSKSTVDLAPLRKQWFEKTGIPTVWTGWEQTASLVKVSLHQNKLGFRLKMPLVVRFKDGTSISKDVAFSELTAAIQLSVSKAVLSVDLDPDHETLHSTPELDAQMIDLKEFARVDFIFGLMSEHPDSEATLKSGLAHLPRPDKFGTEFLLRFTLGGIYRGAGKNVEAKAELERALSCPVRKAEFVPIAYLRLARAYEALGDLPAVERCLNAMASAEATLKFPSGALARAKQLFPDHPFVSSKL